MAARGKKEKMNKIKRGKVKGENCITNLQTE